MALMKHLFSLCLLLLLVGGNADITEIADIEYEDDGDKAGVNSSVPPSPGPVEPTPAPPSPGPVEPTPAPPSPGPGETTPAPPSPGPGETTPVPPSPGPGPCTPNPCPSDSTCQELQFNFTCVCRTGLYYNEVEKSCHLAKTFPTDIKLNKTYDPEMSDKNSAAFKKMADEILTALKGVFTKDTYLGSTVLSLRPGSVIADVENFFRLSSSVTEDEVKEELKQATDNANGILSGADITYTDVCTKGFCDHKSTSCYASSGLATCSCKSGYIKLTATQQVCAACPSGQEAVNSEKCEACSFGHSGFNCEESYLLILVVVACVLGTLLLGTLTGAIVLYTRSKKTTKSSEKPTNPTNGNLEFTKPAGMPRIPRVNPSSGWQPSNLEMTESGSRHALVMKDRPENTAMWNYDYPEETRSYKSQTPSRTGYGPAGSNNGSRATRNPYYDAYDDNVRKY